MDVVKINILKIFVLQLDMPKTHFQYRRPDNHDHIEVRAATLDNRLVVPYNPYLLAKFDSHMNVEIHSTIVVVKYLYNYVYKGNDRIAFHIVSQRSTNDINEID